MTNKLMITIYQQDDECRMLEPISYEFILEPTKVFLDIIGVDIKLISQVKVELVDSNDKRVFGMGADIYNMNNDIFNMKRKREFGINFGALGTVEISKAIQYASIIKIAANYADFINNNN